MHYTLRNPFPMKINQKKSTKLYLSISRSSFRIIQLSVDRELLLWLFIVFHAEGQLIVSISKSLFILHSKNPAMSIFLIYFRHYGFIKRILLRKFHSYSEVIWHNWAKRAAIWSNELVPFTIFMCVYPICLMNSNFMYSAKSSVLHTLNTFVIISSAEYPSFQSWVIIWYASSIFDCEQCISISLIKSGWGSSHT